MRHISAMVLATLLAACTKEEPAAPRSAQYWVQCQACAVTYATAEGLRTDTVGWDWVHTFTMREGQALSIQGTNLAGSGSVMVAIRVDGALVDNDLRAYPDTVASMSTTP